MKYDWGDVFISKRVKDENQEYFIKQMVLRMSKCPDCGYVFENAYHKKSNDTIVFTHSFARKAAMCTAYLPDIRTAYHIKRAAHIAVRENG